MSGSSAIPMEVPGPPESSGPTGSGARTGSAAAMWRQMLEAARSGSREAQARLIESLRPYLLTLAEEQVGSDLRPKVAASDVVQNAIYQAWRAFDDFRGHTRAELVSWLQTILVHCSAGAARNFRGAAKRDIARERSLDKLKWERGRDFADAKASPSQHVAAAEQRQEVNAALERLLPRHEHAIRLRNYLGLSFSEMGVALACSDVAARKLWLKAVEKLGCELRSHGLSSS
jgi:RNA polymerase sigma-70 factor (subfamily 1)